MHTSLPPPPPHTLLHLHQQFCSPGNADEFAGELEGSEGEALEGAALKYFTDKLKETMAAAVQVIM